MRVGSHPLLGFATNSYPRRGARLFRRCYLSWRVECQTQNDTPRRTPRTRSTGTRRAAPHPCRWRHRTPAGAWPHPREASHWRCMCSRNGPPRAWPLRSPTAFPNASGPSTTGHRSPWRLTLGRDNCKGIGERECKNIFLRYM